MTGNMKYENINLKKEGVANIWKTILYLSYINTHSVNSFQFKQCYSVLCRKGVGNDQRNARYMIGKEKEVWINLV